MLIFKQLSSIDKVYPNTDYKEKTEIYGTSALKGERVSYQILCSESLESSHIKWSIKAPKNIKVTVRRVGLVPCFCPVQYDNGKVLDDEFYEVKAPGMYPDVLYNTDIKEFDVVRGQCCSLFITCEIKSGIDKGIYPIETSFEAKGQVYTKIFNIKVLDAELPEQKLKYTNWFHADCVADFYNLKIFSEKHWQMIERFMKAAVNSGVNTILTPVFTLPLDTEVGGERPTLQLVDVMYSNGAYTFGFERLKRWICLAQKCGIVNFEISHLFTQWGSGKAPKVVALTKNGYEKIFGWDTDAVGDEYKKFLTAFLKELKRILKDLKIYDNTYFHVSDEPDFEKHYEIYKKEYEIVSGVIEKDKIIDAMSHYEFVEHGLSKKPVVLTSSYEKFLKKGLSGMWAYNCCIPSNDGYSNRYIAMPLYRNRITGMQLYKYNAEGFLHWGFNFYYSRFSKRKVNPFLADGMTDTFPSGDAFVVYPGKNGPLESLRGVAFYEGLQDMRACCLLEKYIGRSEVIKLLESDGEITFNKYPKSDFGILNIRNRINRELELQLNKAD